MKKRKIREGVHWMGAVDWDRRLFDSLIPTPDGTSYKISPTQYKREAFIAISV